MERRTQAIKDSIADAEKQKAQAAELKLRYEKQMSEAKDNGEKIIAEAMEKAARESDKIISEAKREASFMIQNAQEEIQREREQMLKEIKNQVADLAIMAASKVIESNMNTKKNRKLVDEFLDREGVA